MFVRFVGFVIALVLAGPAPAEAQGRSLAKTLTGLGIAAGGVVLAFSRQNCRVAGMLSDEPAAARTFSNVAGDVYQVFHNARDASATKRRAATVRSTGRWTGPASVSRGS